MYQPGQVSGRPQQPMSGLRLSWIIGCCSGWQAGSCSILSVGLAGLMVPVFLLPVGGPSGATFHRQPPKLFYPTGQPDWWDKLKDCFHKGLKI